MSRRFENEVAPAKQTAIGVARRSRVTLPPEVLPLHDAFLKAGRYLRNWSAATLRTYGQALHRLGLETPSKNDLAAWVIHLREQSLTPGGINMYVRAVNSYLTWLHDEGHVPNRLKVKLLKNPLKQKVLLSDPEIRALVHFKPRTVGERRTLTIALLLLDTGLRITEALTLERGKVDMNALLLTVSGKGGKERIVPFSRELRPVLFRWLTHPKSDKGPYVFATRTGCLLSQRNTHRDILALATAAGVQTYVHPHLFRHQYAASFIKRGGDIYRLSRLLGHTAVTTTQIYLRSLGVDDLRAGTERLTPLAC
jgi:integrase/recombinase XerD